MAYRPSPSSHYAALQHRAQTREGIVRAEQVPAEQIEVQETLRPSWAANPICPCDGFRRIAERAAEEDLLLFNYGQ